ncbi:interleukin-11 receptor subunit alpha [Pelobates fuscus]|uniref:interleukin-11 receptor subunit alpha n=1 Tax=Pelobates fuscus TaxID=191477 RepID=UPI002FE482DB
MCILASCLSRLIVILAVISVSSSSSKWGEEGVEYGRIGGSVTLMCSNTNESSVAEWRFNGAPDIPWGFFTDHGHLEIPNIEISAMGNYSCHNQSGGLLSSVLLRVGYAPGLLSVSCRASDYYNFSCYWKSSVETFLPTRYFASYRSNNHVTGTCLQEALRPNMCSVRESQPWSIYQMNITETNPLGSSIRIIEFTVQSIVKPDPPEKLMVEPVPFVPKRLRVSWIYPSTWPWEPQFQLRFRLQYRPVLHQSWSVVETVNLTDVITDAFAGVEHVIQVSARDFLDAGNWSEWSPEVRATPWTSPTTKASEETTISEIESEPEEPINRDDPWEKVAILISFGVLAFVVLVLFLIIGVLIWVFVGRKGKESGIKMNFLAAIHMKALPKTQIL